MFRLVLDEGDALPARDQTHLAEALEAAKDFGERLDVEVVGEVLHEENLVRGQVLVGDDGGGAGPGGLEPGAARRLGRSAGEIGRGSRGAGDWALETLLLLG